MKDQPSSRVAIASVAVGVILTCAAAVARVGLVYVLLAAVATSIWAASLAFGKRTD